MPVVTDAPYFTLAPDWVCEVLSKSTAKIDKSEKLPVYAEHHVSQGWLVDPILEDPGGPAPRERPLVDPGDV